jgi:hypothetical protein
MNKDEALTEVEKILKLRSAVGRDLSETLRELKNEVVICVKNLAITNYDRHPDVISVVYSSTGSHNSNTVWWAIYADIELYCKNRKIEGSKTFYEYIKKAYDVGFVELLLNPETGEKTNRWDIVEIAIFNWMVEEAKLFNWEVKIKEEPVLETKLEEIEKAEEQNIADLIKKIHKKKEEYVLNELSFCEKPLYGIFHVLASRGSFLDDLQLSIRQNNENHSVIIFKDTLSEYFGRVEPELVKDGLGMKALVAIESYHPLDHWVKDFIRRFKAEQGRELPKLEVLSPSHYTEASFDIEAVMLAVQSNIFFAELPADLASKLKEEPAIKNALAKSLWATVAMKHLCRAGTKANNPVDQELCKVENYSHRARTGEWK